MIPKQKLSINKKGKKWKEENVDYFERLALTSYSGNRTSNFRKLTNYDLYNGRFDPKDLEYVCNPLGMAKNGNEFPATLQHYDITSPAINALLGEEMARPDNAIVVSESTDVISRKKDTIKKSIRAKIEELFLAQVDPSTIDPENPPKFEELEKYNNYNFEDLVESQANKILKALKRKLSTKNLFYKGWKDALIAGEEIYWVGIVNGEPVVRRCNPVNINVILANDSDFIDEADAVIETREMTVSQILDEFGDDMTSAEVTRLEELVGNPANTVGASGNPFTAGANGAAIDGGGGSTQGNTFNSMAIRVVRVEWKSLREVGFYKFKDESGAEQEMMVDEMFSLSEEDKLAGNTVEWIWVGEAWEGTKIGTDIYVNVQPKVNQRKSLENPHKCTLGYSGLIYNATNSVSISLVDRMKPYQYLYNILMYRLELAFASDMGKIMLMDISQIPRAEGIDPEQWLYYMKATKVAFINPFEEGKGKFAGQRSTFQNFTSIDMSLANTIQQYVNSLEFIKQQMFYISGVDPARLGQQSADAGLGTTQMNLQQSANVTRPWVEGHNGVKERVYTALIECAKIAYREGKTTQYVLDDMIIDLLEITAELENADFNVYVTNAVRDQQSLDMMKQLFQSALQYDKATLSDIAKVAQSTSVSDIQRMLERSEQAKYERDAQAQEAQQQTAQQQMQLQKQMHDEQLAENEKDRQLKQYEVDANNETKLRQAEINIYAKREDVDLNSNGIPDPAEIADQALRERDQQSKAFIESQKLLQQKDATDKNLELEREKLKVKMETEKLKSETALKVAKENRTNMEIKANKKPKK